MALRPAAAPHQPISIETLLARHAAPAQRPLASRPAPRTLADLERDSSLARAPALDHPRALVLVTTHATCSCGRTYTLPNRAVLLRYDNAGLSNSVHYTQQSDAPYAALPRERKIIEITVPYCDECF